ncbi:MAG: UDP-N-acetylmuramate dehydrogenase [Planctomycetota bacterium]
MIGDPLEPRTPMPIEHDALIPTWFRLGGRAERLAYPRTVAEVERCVRADPTLRVLGDGANLLVDDDGVDGLVISLQRGALADYEIGVSEARVVAGAGVPLPKLINACVRAGLAGPERLAGIPATVGGAAAMNAGGSFGAFAELVDRVHVVSRTGALRVLERDAIDFGYRRGVASEWIVTLVELALEPEDPASLRDRRAEVMAYKARTQPMSERSAGCAFRNPTLERDLESIGAAGERISAGLLIDRAGCKGLAVGGASVSDRHANFVTTRQGASARDVVALLDEVARRVRDALGVTLRREVVVWSRDAAMERRSTSRAESVA